MSWLQQWWKWLLAGTAVLVAFVLGLFSSRRRSPVSTEERKRVEEKTEELVREAEKQRDIKVEEAKKEHAEGTAELEEAQRKRVEELKDKPDEANEFLLEVGKKMRE